MQTKPNGHTLTLRGFRGMDPAGSHIDAAIPRDIVNFRIGENGCLIKREGFRRITSLHSKPRAFYSGAKQAYLLVGDELFSFSHEDLSLRYISRIPTNSGNAFFLPLGSSLYIADSLGVYLIQENDALPVDGYIPHIANEWADTVIGETYEKRNVLSLRARLTYRIVSETSIFLYAGDEIGSVEEVYINGELIDPERYYLDDHYGTLNVRGMNPGDFVLVVLTFKHNTEEMNRMLRHFLSSTGSISLPGGSTLRFFCWQENDPSATVVFTEHVSKEARLASAQFKEHGNDLYLVGSSEFNIGAQECAVTAALVQRGELLLFTEEDAWEVSPDPSDTSRLPTRCIHTAVGAKNRLCATLAGNDPITFDGNSVWLWGEEDVGGARRVTNISSPIDGIIAKEKGEYGLFYNRFSDELLLYNRTTGTVFVRNMRDGHWTRFCDIPAEEFFEGSGSACFYTANGDICIFDSALSVDLPDGETPKAIVGSYVSGALEIKEGKKQSLLSCSVCADLNGEMLTATLRDTKHSLCSCTVREREDEDHTLYRRLRSPRFRMGEFSMHTEGFSPTVIHSLELNFL